jgi:hypothetical protein
MAILPPMLHLARTTTIPQPPQIEFEYGFSIFWNDIDKAMPHSWWGIEAPGHYILVEVHTPTGLLTSIECPLCGSVHSATSPLWDHVPVSMGHPVFEHDHKPFKVHWDPERQAIAFEYTASEVKIHWGVESRALRSGRCIFGLDARDDLVSVGITDMTPRECEKLRRGVGAA